jgi:hypothetical protein
MNRGGMSMDNQITLKEGTIKRIHVNQHIIKANGKTGERNAPLTVKTSKGNYNGSRIKVVGEMEVVYHPDSPLNCGAKVWLETKASVTIE